MSYVHLFFIFIDAGILHCIFGGVHPCAPTLQDCTCYLHCFWKGTWVLGWNEWWWLFFLSIQMEIFFAFLLCFFLYICLLYTPIQKLFFFWRRHKHRPETSLLPKNCLYISEWFCWHLEIKNPSLVSIHSFNINTIAFSHLFIDLKSLLKVTSSKCVFIFIVISDYGVPALDKVLSIQPRSPPHWSLNSHLLSDG